MDRKVKSFRLRVDLLEWVESYADSRNSTQIVVLETALQNLKDLSVGGVPDLPVAEVPAPRPKTKPAPRQQTQHDLNMIRQRALNESKYR